MLTRSTDRVSLLGMRGATYLLGLGLGLGLGLDLGLGLGLGPGLGRIYGLGVRVQG